MNIRVKRVYLVQFAFSLPLLRKDIYDLFFKNFKHITHFNFNTSNIFYVLQLFCFVFVLFFLLLFFVVAVVFFWNQTDFRLLFRMQSGLMFRPFPHIAFMLNSMMNLFELKCCHQIFCVVFYFCYNNGGTYSFAPNVSLRLDLNFRMHRSRGIWHIIFFSWDFLRL